MLCGEWTKGMICKVLPLAGKESERVSDESEIGMDTKNPQTLVLTDKMFKLEDYMQDNVEAKKKAVKSYKSEAANWE